MKTVWLIRHGKSDWKAGLADKERPLNNRGIQDTSTMAGVISSLDNQAQLYFYSSAKRTEQTTFLLADHLKIDTKQLICCPELYLCHREAIYDLIHFAPDNIDAIAIVGHNPAISEVAGDLGNDKALYLPTLAIQVMRFDTDDWEKIDSNNCISRQFFTPKDKK